MHRRNIAAAAFSAVLLTGGVAYAAPYGTAGCGLGSVVFGDQEGIVQVVAATLNGFAGTQTFGITSGTLNCGKATVDVRTDTQKYIEGNREVLARDVARGQGDTIVGIAAIVGCGDAKKVGKTLQSRYEAIFPSEATPNEQVTEAILGALKADPSLACTKAT